MDNRLARVTLHMTATEIEAIARERERLRIEENLRVSTSQTAAALIRDGLEYRGKAGA